jgi:segregation and condensation protein B
MSLKAKIEAIIYATETPVTVEQITALVKESVAPPEAMPETEALEAGASGLEPIVAGPVAVPPMEPTLKARVKEAIEELIAEYGAESHGIEIRSVAGGYRMATKPEHHDLMRGFAKSLKPPIRLSLAALETLAVIAYKQPVTVPEISEIRGVDAGGVIATLLDRKLITTAGRKQVIGRPILYKTTKEFLMRFGLNEVGELPSMEEFEKLVSESFQNELFEEGSSAPGTAELEAPESESASETASDSHDATTASTEAVKS